MKTSTYDREKFRKARVASISCTKDVSFVYNEKVDDVQRQLASIGNLVEIHKSRQECSGALGIRVKELESVSNSLGTILNTFGRSK